MNQTKTAFALLVVFFAGCAASRFVFVVPAARAGTNPQRWEYACAYGVAYAHEIETANQYGAQGWELVTKGEGSWCFKRPLP
jgi:hypothetical protein